MKRIAEVDRFDIRRGRMVFRAVMVSLLSTAVMANDGSPNNAARTNETSVALNQAVSLEEAPTTQADGSLAVLGDPAHRTDQATKVIGPLSSLKPRTIKPPSTREEGRSRSGKSAESVSWYRTGYGALAIVLSLVGLAAWATRRWMPAMRVRQSDILRVVARANVTPKHSVALVHLGRRFVMVGIGGDQLSSLCEVSDPDEVAELLARVGASHVPPVERGFENMLLSETGEYQSAEKDGQEEASPSRGRPQRDGSAAGDLLHKLRAMQIES